MQFFLHGDFLVLERVLKKRVCRTWVFCVVNECKIVVKNVVKSTM